MLKFNKVWKSVLVEGVSDAFPDYDNHKVFRYLQNKYDMEDESWKNDTMPSLSKELGSREVLWLYVDYADYRKREIDEEGVEMFHTVKGEEYGDFDYETARDFMELSELEEYLDSEFES